MKFKLVSDYQPTGDQPQAIQQLVEGIENGQNHQCLLGVTGSGKTFTVANVINKVNKPTLILSHNKTLAAQLYNEFKNFFPDNAVEYFVSYYDYYQPEAYIPTSNTYIEKDLSINDEIEKLRLSATSALLSGRPDVIVVSSVSCIYGIGNPKDFGKNVIELKTGQQIVRNQLLLQLVQILYARNEIDFQRGNFRVKGDTVDVYLAYADHALRINFWGDEIEEMMTIDPDTAKTIEKFDHFHIYPANIFVADKDVTQIAINEIGEDMVREVAQFKSKRMLPEANRLEERVNYDMEMIRELGYCSGIENYSRYFDRRSIGERPFCLLDYFPNDFLMVIDESHVTIPQIRGMYGGDRSRKENLVEYGFRLSAALDNRPLKFEEFEGLLNQAIYVSATPADYELNKSEGVLVDQVIRPTGLLDPIIEVRPSVNQVDDLIEEIYKRIEAKERVLITTLTKRMSEELDKYLAKLDIKAQYIHSDVDTLDRIDILQNLREGKIDVLVGVNLLREGLDLPEVSLVAILDADKEGFLRSYRSLVQTIGRAARNLNGKAIMYADKITESMRKTIDETERRRKRQEDYNTAHGLVPQAIIKKNDMLLSGQKEKLAKKKTSISAAYQIKDISSIAADPVYGAMTPEKIKEAIKAIKKKMELAAKDLDFIKAAEFRDEMFQLEKMIEKN